MREAIEERFGNEDAPVVNEPEGDDVTMEPQLYGDELKRYEEIKKRKDASNQTRYSRSDDDAPVIEVISERVQYARKGPSKWFNGVEYPWNEKRGEFGRWRQVGGRPFYRSYNDAVQAASKKKING